MFRYNIYLQVRILGNIFFNCDAMIIHYVGGDGAPAVGGLVADSTLIGALVPLVVFDWTDMVLSRGGDTVQGYLMTTLARHPLDIAL